MSHLPPSRQTTLGILLGASAWPNSKTLQASHAFARSAHKVRDYFLHSGPFKMPIENWKELFDTELNSFNEIDKAISSFLHSRMTQMEQQGTPARDLIFYYIGHGMFASGYNQEYYLALRSTSESNLRASGIPFAALAETLKTHARYVRRVLILDCCFAAESYKYLQSAPDQAAHRQIFSALEEKSKGNGFPGKGTALLSSSGNKVPSLILPDESGTMFSEALIRTLMRGNANQQEKPYLSLDDLKGELINTLAKVSSGKAPIPHFDSPDQSEGDVASVRLFPNPQARNKRKQVRTSTPPSGSLPQKTREKWLRDGNSIRDPKRAAEALSTIEQAIRQYPNEAVAYYAKGYTLTDLGRPEEALVAIKQAIRLDPTVADFYKGMGNCHLDLKRYEEALVAYEQAILLKPNYVNAHYNRGLVFQVLQSYDKALLAYEQAIQYNPNYAEAYANKGNILEYFKRYEEALVAYEQAIRLNPNGARSFANKGYVLRQLKRYEEALVAYEQAIRLNPNDDTLVGGKGVALYNLGRYEEALASYNQAIRLDPSFIAYYGCKGETLYALKRYEEAITVYTQMIKLDPKEAAIYEWMGHALKALNRIDEANYAYQKARELG
ncbi:tetratricopeptide repeat protein [Ktedonobacteria bacterium brp13]|nr:tetratricopeptide repeat protein [Ktedonobacteria bacterium brp13]